MWKVKNIKFLVFVVSNKLSFFPIWTTNLCFPCPVALHKQGFLLLSKITQPHFHHNIPNFIWEQHQKQVFQIEIGENWVCLPSHLPLVNHALISQKLIFKYVHNGRSPPMIMVDNLILCFISINQFIDLLSDTVTLIDGWK